MLFTCFSGPLSSSVSWYFGFPSCTISVCNWFCPNFTEPRFYRDSSAVISTKFMGYRIISMELETLKTPSKSISSSIHSVSRSQPSGSTSKDNVTNGIDRENTKTVSNIAVSSPFPNSQRQIIKARIQFASLCWCLFLHGWNDGTTGPLLPRIRKVYHVILSNAYVSPLLY
jgi:hypothetical protein